VVLLLLAVCGGAHLARIGTPAARWGTVALIAVGVVLLVVRWRSEQRTFGDLGRTLARVLLPSDRQLGQRALRAVRLVERTAEDDSAGSPQLARVHFERLLARASLQAVQDAADKRAARWRTLMLALLLAIVAAFAVGPMRVIEGLDVLFARHGRAPLPLAWLDYMRVTAEPPAYLRLGERAVIPGLGASLPAGTLLTVRGVPRRDGRRLVLTDGEQEVPFVADGSGGVVARWTVNDSRDLEIAARFGTVLVGELEPISVRAVPDATPTVKLEGAPKTFELKKVDGIDIRYEASDDHGLKQIDLVLRAGDREDRRTLARLDGEGTFEQGGYAIEPRDAWLRRMYLPVIVTVEAKDNDPVAGPKWGSSEAFTLVPPIIGEPEAARFVALAGVRDELTDFLAWQMVEAKGKETVPPGAKERDRARQVVDSLRRVLGKSHGGLSVPRGLSSFLLGQARILERPLRAGESRVRRTEDVLLAADVALRMLATRDAQSVSKRLADVVEEVANGAKQARETEKKALGLARLDSALTAAQSSAKELSKLGLLGADLGSVARADLGRVERSRKAEDLFHAELAARHLAARLRRPNPSFGGGRRGGVESGSGMGGGAPSGEPSDAKDRFDELAEELSKLVQDHASEIASVQESLSEAEQGVSLDNLRDEARRRAESLRRALAGLPPTSHVPGSARAAAALGREHGGAMAQNLERLSLGDAVQSGRDAMSALNAAEKKAKGGSALGDWLDEGELAAARKEVKAQLDWAEKQLNELKQRTEERARSATMGSSEREQKLSRRAGNLAARGTHGETALPEDAVDSLEKAESIMRDAARELGQGKGERGLELQREAQRLLERANTGQTGDEEDPSPHDQSRPSPSAKGGNEIRTGGEVPARGDTKDAEAFRRRVLEGLGKSKDGRLSPAVRRYAEGLLR